MSLYDTTKGVDKNINVPSILIVVITRENSMNNCKLYLNAKKL